MPVTKLSLDTLKLYFDGSKHHPYYNESVSIYETMRFHANGNVYDIEEDKKIFNKRFKKLILERRPNESDEIKEYREKIYSPQTKIPFTKVLNSLTKIRRSPDWNINYDNISWPARIPDGERLNDYCEINYPGYTSITNWLFTVGLKNYGIDPNCVISVFPLNFDIEENEFFKAVATLFNSDKVIYFEENAEFVILQSSETSDITNAKDEISYQSGKVFYVISATEFSRYDQVNTGNDYQRTQNYIHNLGYIPVFKIPSVFLAQKENTIIQESRLNSLVIHLDESAREYSDLQAAKVQGMFPLFWYFQNLDCPNCKGIGELPPEPGCADCRPELCNKCGGSGKVKFSPYASLALKAPGLGEQQVPVPPAGNVVRDVAILKLQDESVDKHNYKALSSVNMQFLDQTPLSISGDAKQVDREELNNFVYSIAEDLIKIIDNIYSMINDWRYSFVVPDKKAREAMKPKITVPENFDLLPTDYLMDNVSKSKTAKVNPVLIGAMETDYANKVFYGDPDVAALVSLSYKLDPLPALSDEEKMVRLTNKGVTEIDYIISSNIITFIRQALQDDEEFASKKYNDQIKALQTLAKAKQKEISKAEEVRQAVAPQVDEFGNPIQPVQPKGAPVIP